MVRASQSGYINGKLFQEYGEHFVKYLIEKKILVGDAKVMVLLDMHKAHLFNLGFMEYMKARKMEVCCFPPHCTHQSQLMRINTILSGHCMTRIQFFRVLVPAYAGSMTPEAIRSGFRNTGIYPPNKGTEKLTQITASEVYDICKSIVGLGYVNVNVRSRFFVL